MSLSRHLRFGVVGSAAAIAHFLVAVGFVSLAAWAPQLANVAGYCVALIVSYVGQSLWTFEQDRASIQPFAKFAVTSLAGFLLNAAAYGALLGFTGMDYRLALALVLLLVAALTYLSLRSWVFPASPRASS